MSDTPASKVSPTMAQLDNELEEDKVKLQKSYYTIVGPRVIRSEYKYSVAVTVHQADGPCKFSVGLKGPSYHENKTVEVQPFCTQNVEFDVPKLKDGNYFLLAEGLEGITFQESKQLRYEPRNYLVFVQTDKATYIPGDLVQFRVLFLDLNTRPAQVGGAITMKLTDTACNNVKQWRDIKLVKGVFTSSFQLCEEPVLGSWKFTVTADGADVATKDIVIEKYVLPKFEVKIETEKDVAVADGIVKVTVRANYTYGSPVKGKATVTVDPNCRYSHYPVDKGENTKSEKVVDAFGKVDLEFDLCNDLHLNSDNMSAVEVRATFEEDLTGNTQEAETVRVILHEDRYRLSGVDPPTSFKPGQTLTCKVSVRNLDSSPVQDTKNPVKLIVDPPSNYYNNPMKRLRVLETTMNAHGEATFEFTLPETKIIYNNYCLKCEYLDTTAEITRLTRLVPQSKKEEYYEMLNLTVTPDKPCLGQPVSVEVKSCKELNYFHYALVARGNIIKSENIKLPAGQQVHVVQFTPTFEMVPEAKLFVHFIHEGEMHFKETSIQFEKSFVNAIAITAAEEVKPGDEVQLQVKTDPGSLVGLLGIDQSVYLLRTGNDLSSDKIFDELREARTCHNWNYSYDSCPGHASGLSVISNICHLPLVNPLQRKCFGTARFKAPGGANEMAMAFGAAPAMACYDAPAPMAAPVVRKNFVDSWIFENFDNFDGNNLSVTKKIPDTITSWILTGFALSPETGLALTEQPTKIKTFRPFFISTNLPYSIKRGEAVSIPVILFNYTAQNLDAEITLENNENEFVFVEEDKGQERSVRKISVSSSNAQSVSFLIRPTKLGHITLKITALSALAGDAIHKKLKVEPEGVTVYNNRDFYLYAEGGSLNVEDKLQLDIPAGVVPDSELIEVSIMGDILGSTIANIDNLVRMPYGCGEQNMVNFVPNILVLQYLGVMKQLNPAIEEKARRYMEIGYQRELTYKHEDGSYSAFGPTYDGIGSTWLTAYVVRSFHQAAKYITIDPVVLERGLEYLQKQQTEAGNFKELGKLFDFSHHNDLGLTAFVLLAFLECTEYLLKYQQVLERGFDYLLKHIKDSKDLYANALATFTLSLLKVDMAADALTQLDAEAKTLGGLKWWSKTKSLEECRGICIPRSNDVEITAYVVMALLVKGDSVLPSMKWLISQRNSQGGYTSTQDTVVGLMALIHFANKIGAGDTNVEIAISTGASDSKANRFEVNKDNSMVVQTLQLPKDTREIAFSGKGTGTAVLQISYRYNIVKKDEEPSFKLETKVKPSGNPGKLLLDAIVAYVPVAAAAAANVEPGTTDNTQESNMVVMEVSLPSGYAAVKESFEKILKVERVKRVETKNADSKIIIYFESLKRDELKTIPIVAERLHEVTGQKPVPVVVYDYYDSQRRATQFYALAA